MTSILNEFEICAKIPQNTKINIKSFYVFSDVLFEKNVIFITNDDKVYGLGNNFYGALGLGHNRDVEECTQIQELSHQKINEFFSGHDFVLCKNKQGSLFSWGKNDQGQLGRSFESKKDEFLMPEIIDLDINDKIEYISCGSYHTLILLSNGLLYGWGSNNYGQLCMYTEASGSIINKPGIKMNEKIDMKFKYIYCRNNSSFAITTNGLLYSWGYNGNGILGQGMDVESCIPRQVNLFNIQKICSNESNAYFLTNEGSIYFCGLHEMNGKNFVLNSPKKIKKLKTTNYIDEHAQIAPIRFLGQSLCIDFDKGCYKLCGGTLEMLEIKYKTVNQLYAKRLGITAKLTSTSVNNQDVEPISYSTIYFSSYKLLKMSFRLISIIGTGGFGTVGKYWNLSDKQFFAIKEIKIKDAQAINNDQALREVETMIKLKSHFVVRYNNSWIENNRLFIQMEYCFDNLRNVLIIKPMVFKRKDDQAMNSIEYYISCEIFRQITEALNYLHFLKPEPLIHRDLKPENILIGDYNNKKICKLADFGLSKFIENHSDYHTMIGATHKYRAPEIASCHRYDTKIDVYSLGMIGLEIFNLDKQIIPKDGRQLSWTQIFGTSIGRTLEKCDQLITHKLLTPKRHQRISCEELLTQIEKLKLSENKAEFKAYRQRFQDMNMQYFSDVFSD